MTDNEFDVLKLDAMQTELANLMKNIQGVNDAKVMITLPNESVWANEKQEKHQHRLCLIQRLVINLMISKLNLFII
ncbi:hypothetical protein AAAC51_06055 [Priestia megaterium]